MAFGSSRAGSAPFEKAPAFPDVVWIRNALDRQRADDLMARLLDELELRADLLTIAGAPVATKRLHDFRADPGMSYHYSGGDHAALPWTPALSEAKAWVEASLGLRFNACLCNYYADGKVGMGWHADKEAELGADPNIASLSLGASRLFRFRRRSPWRDAPDGKEIWDYELAPGDLLLMRGNTQQYFEHELPPRAAVKSPRLNLTFRLVLGQRPAGFDPLR